ncbi:MAG: hypothetical protein HOQ05_03585 [Corynebacteriales bacterium]|nr:hypothetical protein [Mycobacteriales bacterium]
MRFAQRVKEAFLGVQLPEGVVVSLEPGEHVTAWARTDSGETLVCTERRLWHVAGNEPVSWRWHTIHKATWAHDALTLIPGEEVEPGVVKDAPPRRWQLVEPSKVPAEVHARVTRSVAHAEHHMPPGVWVIARRIAGRDGLDWVLRFDEGVDTATTRAQADELRTQAQQNYF